MFYTFCVSHFWPAPSLTITIESPLYLVFSVQILWVYCKHAPSFLKILLEFISSFQLLLTEFSQDVFGLNSCFWLKSIIYKNIVFTLDE